MIIEKNKVVTVHYRLQEKDADGKLIEETYGRRPLTFIFRVERMIERFEEELAGLQPGDNFSFTVKKQNAYGEYNPKAVATLPMSAFTIDGEVAQEYLEVGKRIPMQDEQGNRLEGLVVEVREDGVVIDFNHPHAGMDLYFSGRVQDVRDATDSEISHQEEKNLAQRQGQQ